MNCKGKNRLLRTVTAMTLGMAFLILLAGIPTANARARIGSPLQEGADPSTWFDKDAASNYEYHYGYYDPYFYSYYHPDYDKESFEDDWFYDTYAQQRRGRAMPETTWDENATFWGGYDTQDMNDDWFYDYYEPDYIDYYESMD